MALRVLLRSLPVSSKGTLLRLVLIVGVSLGVLAARPIVASAATYRPVAEYSFDEITTEGETETVEDLSGHGHTATVEGAKPANGRYGAALEFDGEESCVKIPYSAELQMSEELTLEAWVRPATEGLDAIVSQEDEESAEGEEGYAYSLLVGGTEEGPRAWFRLGGEEGHAGVYGAEPAALGAWTHVAVTDDGAHLRLYIDGELVATNPAVPLTASHGPLTIGCLASYGNFFKGRIDEMRIYDRALDPGEVDADMEAPIQTPRSGPVAEYSFDEVDTEGETETVEDLTGNGHSATVEGVKPANGRYGGALEFDGEESCVKIPYTPELQMTEELTLEAWVRPGSEGLDAIVSQEDEESAEGEEGYVYSLLVGGTEEGPRAWFRLGGEVGHTGVYGAEPAALGAWTHVAVTDDGAHLRLYIDGELVATNPAVPLTASHGPLTIGCLAGYGNFFEGRIDEVRIYDRALNAPEVDADMETPIQTPRKGPVADYSFDEVATEGETETVEDLTGDGHTATLHGATWTAHGRYGGALDFDAEKEAYVSIPADAGLDGHEELTVEAWVRPSGSPYFGEIAMKEREGPGAGYSWTLDQHSSEPVGYFMQSEEGMVAGGEHSLPLHTWTHVAMTDDGAHDRLYVDGVLVDTAPAVPFDGHGQIRIGGNALFGQWFDGRIDELRIYERALSGAEVAADMESPIQTPKATPVAAYAFDEGEGETAQDVTGNGHTATIEGAEWVRGRYGDALKFDGEDTATIPSSEDLNLTEEFTLEAWIRPEAGCEFGQVFVKEDAEETHAAYVVSKHGSKLGAYLGVPGVEEESPSGSLVVGAWQHIAVTFDGSKATLYVDGEEVGSAPVDEILSTSGDLRLGGSHIGAHGGGFVGRIDEVRIYGRSLNAGEVATDMETPIQTPKQGPIAAWSFDEGEGTEAEDVTGDGHDGTIEGATWARGKYGGALQFDGEDDVVKVPNSPEFALTEGFTLEAWVRPESASNEWAPILAKEIGGGEATEELAWWLYEGDWNANEPFGGTEPAPGDKDEAHADDPLPVDAWSHVALTYDGAKIRLYVDGELVDCSPVPAGAPPITEGELQIGAATEHGDYFKGRIDEIRIYNRALGSSEVSASLGALPRPRTEESESESTEAVLLGTINPMGMPTSYRFEYGPTSSYGQSVPESADGIERWVQGNEPEEVDQAIDELEPETTYHYRIVATSPLGTIVGKDKTFTTSVAEPTPFAATSFEGRVGVNWSGIQTTASEMNLIDESGAKLFRVVVYPGCPTIGGDVKRAQNHNDNLFLTLAQDHITILPDVSGIPCRSNNQLPKIEKGSGALNRWETGLKALAKRYGPDGEFWENHTALKPYAPTYWEIWNEENVERNAADTGQIIPQRYGRLLEVSHDALKEVDGKIKVLFGGLLTIGETNLKAPKDKRKEEREMTIRRFVREAGHSEDYDAVSLHPYAYLGSVTTVTHNVKLNIQAARNAVNKFGGGKGTEIWVTEIGWPVEGLTEPDAVHQSVSPVVQKERLNSVFEKIKAYSGKYNIGSILWYNIQDVSGSEWAAHCGLVEKGGKKRPSFAAFQAQAK